ncbi:MAG: hypothetical protein ACYC64_08920, partial [Armatimonadota bacterium]
MDTTACGVTDVFFRNQILVTFLVGLLAVASLPAASLTWDLAADFSESVNPSGPWAYGEVLVDGSGAPSLNVFGGQYTSFEPADFGSGQKAWYGTSGCPWYWTMMKSKGTSAALDFPAGRCGGHAHTGVRWTAPISTTVNIQGAVWKLRNSDSTFVSLWVKGTKRIDHMRVPDQGSSCNSSNPYSFAEIIQDAGCSASVLLSVHVNAGDEIYVQIDGNDYTGLDLTISEVPASPAVAGAGIRVWYPTGYDVVTGAGDRFFAVSADRYKFVYDLGRPGMTELYNYASGPNLLKTGAGGQGSYLSLTDSGGKTYVSYLSNGNASVTYTKGSTNHTVHQTRMQFRQAGRAYYQLDVVGIKLAASDGTVV